MSYAYVVLIIWAIEAVAGLFFTVFAIFSCFLSIIITIVVISAVVAIVVISAVVAIVVISAVVAIVVISAVVDVVISVMVAVTAEIWLVFLGVRLLKTKFMILLSWLVLY